MGAHLHPEGMTAADSLRLMGLVQMERFCHPGMSAREIALKTGVPMALVRAWAFREQLDGVHKGLSQYRYPEPRDEDVA